MTEPYDSTADTMAHIQRVRELLAIVRDHLLIRGQDHDRSKLEPPEKEAFDRGTPALKGLTYGSPEYRESFAKHGMKDAIAHHYRVNSHHPEFHAFFRDGTMSDKDVKNGEAVAGMTLLDVIEMACADWPAAVERHADGDLLKSLEINRVRFGISDQLVSIIRNTYRELGLIPDG